MKRTVELFLLNNKATKARLTGGLATCQSYMILKMPQTDVGEPHVHFFYIILIFYEYFLLFKNFTWLWVFCTGNCISPLEVRHGIATKLLYLFIYLQNNFLKVHTKFGVTSYFVLCTSYFINVSVSLPTITKPLLFGIIGGGVVGIWITEVLTSVWRVVNYEYLLPGLHRELYFSFC